MKQLLMTCKRNGAEYSEKSLGRQNYQETQSDERHGYESALAKIRLRRLNRLVEADDFLMELCTDAANQPVAERRHLTQQHHRTRLGEPVSLWDRCQDDITLAHGWRSSSVYSGSASP